MKNFKDLWNEKVIELANDVEFIEVFSISMLYDYIDELLEFFDLNSDKINAIKTNAQKTEIKIFDFLSGVCKLKEKEDDEVVLNYSYLEKKFKKVRFVIAKKKIKNCLKALNVTLKPVVKKVNNKKFKFDVLFLYRWAVFILEFLNSQKMREKVSSGLMEEESKKINDQENLEKYVKVNFIQYKKNSKLVQYKFCV